MAESGAMVSKKITILVFALVLLFGFAFAERGGNSGNGNGQGRQSAGEHEPTFYILGNARSAEGAGSVSQCEERERGERVACARTVSAAVKRCNNIENETIRDKCLNLTETPLKLCDRLQNENAREACLRSLESPLKKCALDEGKDKGECLKRLNFPFAQCANLTGNAQGQCLKSILAGPKPCDESDNETNVTECLRNTGFNLQVQACKLLGNESARKFCLKKLEVRDRVLKHECDEATNTTEWNGCVKRVEYRLNFSECRNSTNASEMRGCVKNKCETAANATGDDSCYGLLKRFRWQNENINKLNSNINKLEAVIKYAGTREALGEKWIERFDNRSANTTALKGIYNDFVADVANANDSLASAKQYYADGNYTEALDEMKDALEFLKDAKLKWAEFKDEARAILKGLGATVESEPETESDYE